MKIMIQTPLKNKEIQELLDGKELEGITFTFQEKKGMGLVFETGETNPETACSTAKRVIKDTNWGKILYFSVGVVTE